MIRKHCNNKSSRLKTINTASENKTRIIKNIIEDYDREARSPPGGVYLGVFSSGISNY